MGDISSASGKGKLSTPYGKGSTFVPRELVAPKGSTTWNTAPSAKGVGKVAWDSGKSNWDNGKSASKASGKSSLDTVRGTSKSSWDSGKGRDTAKGKEGSWGTSSGTSRKVLGRLDDGRAT